MGDAVTCLLPNHPTLTTCEKCNLVYCAECRRATKKAHKDDCIAWTSNNREKTGTPEGEFLRKLAALGYVYVAPYAQRADGSQKLKVYNDARGNPAYSRCLATLMFRKVT